MTHRSQVVLVLSLLVTACSSTRDLAPAPVEDLSSGVSADLSGAPAAAGDPRKAEVPLPALSDDWRASLVFDNGATGIWTVESFPVFEQYACPEVIGLDDRGRAIICVSYSGKWTPFPIIEDGKWLGGLEHGDLDPRIDGAELYTGGQLGNLYQVVPYPNGALDQRLIARFPGREIHTLIGGDVDAAHEGAELIVFTRPGGLFRVTADGPDGSFRTEQLQELDGRVRDAVVLPRDPEDASLPPQIATVSRAGWLRLLTLTADGPVWETVYKANMGMGRLSVAPHRKGSGLVLYTTHDDGRILRHERRGGQWTQELIHISTQGPRGVVAGHFDADPMVETLAVFSYGKKVEYLRRAPGEKWTVEEIFEDRGKGHWMARAEVDGRNGTDELILSGYGGRIVLLSRQPGVGRASGTN